MFHKRWTPILTAEGQNFSRQNQSFYDVLNRKEMISEWHANGPASRQWSGEQLEPLFVLWIGTKSRAMGQLLGQAFPILHEDRGRRLPTRSALSCILDPVEPS